MAKNQEDLDKLRHSAAHLLAAAVIELYPKAKRAIGPAIKDGFYYDFDFGQIKISKEELPKIEAKMRRIVAGWDKFAKKMLTAAEAKKQHPQNPYKHELIDEFSQGGKKKVSFYQAGDFADLCRGGHVDNPASQLKHFKLLSVAGAYWRGDEKNPMLTRIYGTIFPTQKELDDYLEQQEEAKKRDHRILGQELGFFAFSARVGKGLPLFTQKGATIWRVLERFVVDEEISRGYQHVRTPNLAKTDLYKKSGHYPYYKDTMYPPMVIDHEELILRPMTCPHHFALYQSKPRSYKDLPLRFAEMASLYRYEKSGELTGLIRVREFTLADSHNFVRKSQAEDEVNLVLDLIEFISQTLGLKKGQDFYYRLSLGDRKNKTKYFDSPQDWDEAEKLLKKVLDDRHAPYETALDEAAFYGPKVDVQMKNVSGKEDTAFTVQYDFCLPARFNLEYTNEKGESEQPVVIHRSSVGAMERSIGFLIEHYAGAFPVWLAPIQAVVLPVGRDHQAYAQKVAAGLTQAGIRVELDDRNATLNAKVRDASGQKIPYILVVGDKEKQANSVAVRTRNNQNLGPMPLAKFSAQVVRAIEEKSLS